MAKVAVGADGKIVGLLIQPAQATQVPAPAVAEDANFSEREVMVGEGERALPGTLDMPKGDGPFPAVVLVHGSGAHDRDETIGPNKPFLDIARGLAAQGVAVLRYEKRSHVRPQDFASGNFGVDDETTNDAVLAVETLRQTAGIDPKRVFVLGHSQGGMMAPRIAMKDGNTAGLVLLAAPARNPVSYTHLDVYKRQGQGQRAPRQPGDGAPAQPGHRRRHQPAARCDRRHDLRQPAGLPA